MSKKHSVIRAAAALVVLLMTVAQPAKADTPRETYGRGGYQWFARYNDLAISWISSNYCNSAEQTAWLNAKNSTKNATGQREWATRWPSGLTMHTERCDGVIDEFIDIKLRYLSPSDWERLDHGCYNCSSTYGGHNHSEDASRDFCALWRSPYPCGYQYSVVHINKYRYTNVYSAASRARLLLHETGHSFAMNHHCTSNSIMNSGQSTCNGGAWNNITGYQAHDRNVMLNVYPNWRYP